MICPITKKAARLRVLCDDDPEARVVYCSMLAPPNLVSCGASCLMPLSDGTASGRMRLIHAEDGEVSCCSLALTRAQLPDPENGFG